MLNKNDPLIGAVQEVMKRNQTERNAAKLVNEKFGVTDRKALPHEKQSAWDAAYKQILSEGLHPNQQKLDVHEPEKDKLTKKDFEMLRAKKKPMEEMKTDPYAEQQAGSVETIKPKEKSVTPADQSKLKSKIQSIMKEAKANPYAIGMAAVKKSTGDQPPMEKKNIMKAHKIAKKIIAKKKIDEGFNNRHDLSVTASAEKQVVAGQLNEKIGNPLLLNRAKARSRMGDSGVKRPISGTNNPQTRLARMRKSAPALDSTRNAALDKPGLEKAGVAQALKDPKARETLAQTTRDAAEFAVPSAMTGGPIGNMIGRGLGTAVSKGYSYLKNLTKSAPAATKSTQVASQAASPATSVANKFRANAANRRYNVSGSQQKSPQKPAVTQSGVPSVAQGVGQRNRLAAVRRSAQGPWNRPTTPNAAASNAARMAVSQRLAQAGTKAANVVKNNPKLAAGAAGGAAMTGFAATKVGNQPPAAQAKPAKDQSRIPAGLSPAEQQRKAEQDKVDVKRTQPTAPSTVAMTARKIEATPRKVSDTEIMNAPQYKQAVKAAGGEAGARKIQAGTDVAGVGKVEKGQTIWSKVKSQLEKQPAAGFEARKVGAGR